MFFLQFANEKDMYGPFKSFESIDDWIGECATDYRIISPLHPEYYSPTNAHFYDIKE